MKVMVTGGAGFIGSAVCRHLVRDLGIAVVNVDKLTYAASLDSVAAIAADPRYRFYKLDICDRGAMLEVMREEMINAVMHLAAESHVDRSIDGPAAFIRTNIEGTFALLEAARAWRDAMPAARKAHFRFHHVSTDEVFGDLPLDGGTFTEASTYAPSSPYSASKAAADHLVRAWHKTYGLPVVLSKCSNNYGPYHFPEKLIPLAIINGLEERPIPVYGTGANVRDWFYVEDHARALGLVLTKGETGQSYNIGGRSERSNLAVVEAIADLLDVRAPLSGRSHRSLIAFVGDRPGHDLRYAIDCSKIERQLGWRAEETFETGLARTVDWFIANSTWWQDIRARRLWRRTARNRASVMRLAVTGRTGQLACALIERAALTPAIEVIALGRPDLDLEHPATVAAAIRAARADLVVNAAAFTAVDRAEAEPEHALAVNRDGAAAVARAAAALNAPFIQLSTDYVFAGTEPGARTEADATAPVNAYGRSKLAGEIAVREAHPGALILRTSWLYSPFGSNFVKTMLRLGRERNVLRVVDDQWGNPTSALDLADAILRLAPRLAGGSTPAATFHLAGAGATTWCGLARYIFEVSGALGGPRPEVAAIASADYPTPAHRPLNSSLNCTAFAAAFGFSLEPWQEGVEPVVQRLWPRRNPAWAEPHILATVARISITWDFAPAASSHTLRVPGLMGYHG